MKVIIETSFPVREKTITSYTSYPAFSAEIEKTLVRQLEFLRNYKGSSLVLSVLI